MNRITRVVAHGAALALIVSAVVVSRLDQRDPDRLPPGGPPGWIQVTCTPWAGRTGDCYIPPTQDDDRQAPRCDKEPEQMTCHIQTSDLPRRVT